MFEHRDPGLPDRGQLPVGLAAERGDLLGMLVAARSPIYLIITKWDIVRGFGEAADADDNTRLDLVRHAMLTQPQLRGLVQTRGMALPNDDLSPSDLILPPADASLDEISTLLHAAPAHVTTETRRHGTTRLSS